MQLTVSIVTFRSDPSLFIETLQSLARAVIYAKARLPELKCLLYIVENESVEKRNFIQVEQFLRQIDQSPDGLASFDDFVISAAEYNLGYGRGHNRALHESISDYHLVLNPDVELTSNSLLEGLSYLQSHSDVALISPSAVDSKGVSLHLCKQYPSVFDFFLRGFAPLWLKKRFSTRLGRYEMHDLKRVRQAVTGMKIISGCCMLFRTDVLRSVGGFDDRFFLYFEDFDLSLRISKIARIDYYPAMKIVHYGGNAARKGPRHVMLFASSAIKFFKRHGWRFI